MQLTVVRTGWLWARRRTRDGRPEIRDGKRSSEDVSFRFLKRQAR